MGSGFSDPCLAASSTLSCSPSGRDKSLSVARGFRHSDLARPSGHGVRSPIGGSSLWLLGGKTNGRRRSDGLGTPRARSRARGRRWQAPARRLAHGGPAQRERSLRREEPRKKKVKNRTSGGPL